MDAASDLPLSLYRANSRLQARLGELLQASSQHWLELGQRLYQESVTEAQASSSQWLDARDWQSLAALPVEAFWRQLELRFDDQQASTQIAVAAQTAFARGLQELVQAWQQETIGALEQAGLTLPLQTPDWAPLFASWQPALARPARGRAAPDHAESTSPAAAARSRPAAKRADTKPRPAKQATRAAKATPARASRKPAAKTTSRARSK